MGRPDLALLFPPTWYFHAVPADLSVPAGHLRAQGLDVRTWNLSAEASHGLLSTHPGWATLRSERGLADPTLRRPAVAALREALRPTSERFKVSLGLRALRFPGRDPGDLALAAKLGTSPRHNPLRGVLARAAAQVVSQDPRAAAIALVHPEQRVHAVALAALLRAAGFQGELLLYGDLEDQLSPLDLAEDLSAEHKLWRLFDGVILADGPRGLEAALQGTAHPTLLRRGDPIPRLQATPLETLGLPGFADVKAEHHPFPTPVVDLRLGRGCPWGRCTFCAIHAHQTGYVAGPIERVVAAMARAHQQLGSTRFRLRDDLLTPRQLRDLGEAAAKLDFAPRWSARARIQPGLNARTLGAAAAGGLRELWLGLESGSERVRAALDKGTPPGSIDPFLAAAQEAGVRVRLLCMVGVPGESLAEAQQTLSFLLDRRDRLQAVSITPFQLMRRSLMGQDPEAWGVQLAPDPVPPERRLRARRLFLPSAEQRTIAAWLPQALEALQPIVGESIGPTPAHDWWAAS